MTDTAKRMTQTNLNSKQQEGARLASTIRDGTKAVAADDTNATDGAEHARNHAQETAKEHERKIYEQYDRRLPYDPSLLPNGDRSMSSIGIQSFMLGSVFTGCVSGTLQLVLNGSRGWRLPGFFALLSLFHFLEYYTTARWNTPAARASSFLLFNNGKAYNVAHGLATLETGMGLIFPSYGKWLTSWWSILLGVGLVILGQSVRSIAMAQAGTNFSHLPAQVKLAGHQLVTHGVYSVFRHPSYFGFFWWAIGTQLILGNKVCLLGYALVLWKFFHSRIVGEEQNLTRFFGDDYQVYRSKTAVWIPFIP